VYNVLSFFCIKFYIFPRTPTYHWLSYIAATNVLVAYCPLISAYCPLIAAYCPLSLTSTFTTC
jgi:hypothetical protein